jgi:hypothetical protein
MDAVAQGERAAEARRGPANAGVTSYWIVATREGDRPDLSGQIGHQRGDGHIATAGRV